MDGNTSVFEPVEPQKNKRTRRTFAKPPAASTKSSPKPNTQSSATYGAIDRQDPIDLKGHVFNLTEDAVMKEATVHKKYDWLERYSLFELPRFDGLSEYNISDEDHDELLRKEVKRLIETAESKEPYLFNSASGFTEISETSFEELSTLMWRISNDCDIVALDNATLSIDHSTRPLVLEFAFMLSQKPYRSLRHEHHTKARYRTVKTQGRLSPDQFRRLQFSLIDYTTGCIARLLVRTATFSQWNEQQLALLAQLAVKLKVLSKSSREYAVNAIERAEETVTSFEKFELEGAVVVIQDYVEDKGLEEKHLHMKEDMDPMEPYFVENMMKRDSLYDLFNATLMSLYHSSFTKRGFDDFHYYAVAYETGFDRSLVIISEDKNGRVSTTPRETLTKTCCRALLLARENIQALNDEPKAPPTTLTQSQAGPCYVTMDWAEDEDASSRKVTLSLTKLDSVISVIIPLALSNPIIASYVEGALRYSMGPSRRTYEETVRRFKHPRFEASISVQTSTNIASQQKVRREDPNTVPIIRSSKIGELRVDTSIDSDWGRKIRSEVPGTLSHTRHPGYPLKFANDVHDDEDVSIDEWIFAATTITVHCKAFVFGILIFCAILVIGALFLPFFVKDKIPGVDPFQITTFTWLVVGVILITAKGRYVKEWPWHDFVHGRVVCDSITDLADVTRINEQKILMKLLHNERSLNLLTRGPYNGMFTKQSESPSEGFSIDEPVKLSTMLKSGFIILKVISHQGEHIVCLDARKKSYLDFADSDTTERTYLSCLEMPIPEVTTGRKGRKTPNVFYLQQNDIGWNKLVGLFVGEVVFG